MNPKHLGLTLSKMEPCDHYGDLAMPSAAARAKRASRSTCDTSNIHREWRQEAAVRHTAVNTDRLFQSHQDVQGGERHSIKFSIKDAVHNEFVLAPLLFRMARDRTHPIPYLEDLARESLAYLEFDQYLFSIL